jgi:hypothetical protein
VKTFKRDLFEVSGFRFVLISLFFKERQRQNKMALTNALYSHVFPYWRSILAIGLPIALLPMLISNWEHVNIPNIRPFEQSNRD